MNPGIAPVVEHASHPHHPWPGGAEAQSAGPGGVRGHHTANGAESPTRWVDGKAEPHRPRRFIDGAPQGAGPHYDAPSVDLHWANGLQARQVDHDPGPHGAGRHTAPGAARNERGARALGPRRQRPHILGIGRHRHRGRHAARDTGPFGVQCARQQVRTEQAAETCWPIGVDEVARGGGHDWDCWWRLVARNGLRRTANCLGRTATANCLPRIGSDEAGHYTDWSGRGSGHAFIQYCAAMAASSIRVFPYNPCNPWQAVAVLSGPPSRHGDASGPDSYL